jgi:hypothetical protein
LRLIPSRAAMRVGHAADHDGLTSLRQRRGHGADRQGRPRRRTGSPNTRAIGGKIGRSPIARTIGPRTGSGTRSGSGSGPRAGARPGTRSGPRSRSRSRSRSRRMGSGARTRSGPYVRTRSGTGPWPEARSGWTRCVRGVEVRAEIERRTMERSSPAEAAGVEPAAEAAVKSTTVKSAAAEPESACRGRDRWQHQREDADAAEHRRNGPPSRHREHAAHLTALPVRRRSAAVRSASARRSARR